MVGSEVVIRHADSNGLVDEENVRIAIPRVRVVFRCIGTIDRARS